MASGKVMEPDVNLIRDVKKAGGDTLKRCYQCATCSVVCNLSPQEKPFPRKEMLWAQWGMTDKLAADPDIWLCHQCNDCSINCPRGARPGDVLAAIRTYIYKKFAFPSFMGKALANPTALPFLFLVPVLILIACIYFSAPLDANGQFVFLTGSQIDYNLFLPHSTVDALFVFGNILIFLFAAIGFNRFWKGLKAGGHDSQLSFVGALIKTIAEIISHKSFNQCDTNKSRSIWHMVLFFGFIGSMITTGLVFILIFIPHYLHEWKIFDIYILPMPPIELPSPIKIIGALSGVALMVGGAMLVIRRWSNRDEVGANGYADYLFLYVMFVVGLTGMLSWIFRSYVGVPMLAYVTYFVHMVFVYFLLWYMPYSKFAHMIYRTLAMVYARSIDRRPRSFVQVG
ncbi:MAG: quinone-interacting membrane-bound oxidoreductase complex subunit QmoC [candidate division Zixibacteria bacterium]|nr:quinone-interacting membrane-bound oxidoreductase complex subunit QmoC [candidate division Zixibacteria bacterium]